MVLGLQHSHLGEELVVPNDEAAGLTGIVAIHSTVLGLAAGGCRFRRYPDDGALAGDAVRLAAGMSCKNALAGHPFGGGSRCEAAWR